MSDISTVPPTTRMSEDPSEVDTTIQPARQAARNHWQNIPGGKLAGDIKGTDKSSNAVATTQPDTVDENGSTKTGDTVDDGNPSSGVKETTASTPMTAVEDDRPGSSRFTLGTFLGGIYTAVKDTINWAYEHPAESAAIVAGVGAAAATAYKAYQTEYQWGARTKPEVTDTIVLSTSDDMTDANAGEIWGKAKSLWNGGLSNAWRSGWNEGLASNAGGTGASSWCGTSKGPVVDVTVPTGSTVHLSGA